jgi:hypothetical protein
MKRFETKQGIVAPILPAALEIALANTLVHYHPNIKIHDTILPCSCVIFPNHQFLVLLFSLSQRCKITALPLWLLFGSDLLLLSAREQERQKMRWIGLRREQRAFLSALALSKRARTVKK